MRGHRAVRFLIASGVSLYGDWLTTVALVVLLYRATGSPTAPALYMVARVAPRIFGPTPGGALADRYGPARVAATCSLLQGGLTALIVVFAYSHVIWAIYVAVMLAQFLNSVAQPSYGALIPRVSSERQLGRVNGIYSSLFSSSILVSPAIGALLLPHIAAEVLIIADACTFVFAAALLSTLHRVAPPVPGTPLRSLSVGLGIVIRDGVLRSFAAASLGIPAVVTALQAVLVVAASQRFGHDTNVGWLYAAVGAGGLLGSITFLRATPARVGRTSIIVASFVELAPLGFFVIAPNIFFAAMLLFVSSLGGVLYQVRGQIGLQQRVPTELLGRVNAVIRSALYTGMLIGAVSAAILVQPLGWQATVVLLSVVAFVFLVIASAVRPRRRFQHPVELIPD